MGKVGKAGGCCRNHGASATPNIVGSAQRLVVLRNLFYANNLSDRIYSKSKMPEAAPSSRENTWTALSLQHTAVTDTPESQSEFLGFDHTNMDLGDRSCRRWSIIVFAASGRARLRWDDYKSDKKSKPFSTDRGQLKDILKEAIWKLQLTR